MMTLMLAVLMVLVDIQQVEVEAQGVMEESEVEGEYRAGKRMEFKSGQLHTSATSSLCRTNWFLSKASTRQWHSTRFYPAVCNP